MPKRGVLGLEDVEGERAHVGAAFVAQAGGVGQLRHRGR